MGLFQRLWRVFGPLPRSPVPRLPLDELKDNRIHGRWDVLNGR